MIAVRVAYNLEHSGSHLGRKWNFSKIVTGCPKE